MARSTILGDIRGGLWTLDREAFDHLEATRPFLVVAIPRDIVRLQSERLAFATRQNAARA